MAKERLLHKLPHKLLFTAAYLALVLGLSYGGMRCLFRQFLSIPCPGCGMTRAFLSLLRLDFAAARGYHPMVFALPLMYLYFLLEGKLFRKKGVDAAVWVCLGLGFLAHWLHLIFG